MGRYLARRLAQGAGIVVVVASVTFFLIHLAPGDPFSSTMDNPLVTEAVRERWRVAYGLDRPVVEQYWLYLRNVTRGDFGYSYSLHQPVGSALAVAIPRTLLLMAAALIASFAAGVAL